MNTNTTPDGTVMVSTIYGDFYSWKDDLITRQLTEFSAHTRNELAMLNSFIEKGDAIIDVGGHIGTYSIPFAIQVGEQGKVFTFEANANNFSLLEKNIDLNGKKQVIQATNAVVSLKDDMKFGMDLPDGGNSGMYYFSSEGEATAKQIPAINIDSWFASIKAKPNISLIKIDVEGAEMGILYSCEKLIKRYKPMLYIEISREALKRFDHSIDDLHSFLTKHGYDYFKNIGERNSSNDLFEINSLSSIEEGGAFFDLLAFHKQDKRKPSQLLLSIKRARRGVLVFVRKVVRKLVSLAK